MTTDIESGSFVVELAQSGRQFTIQRGQSILGTLRDAGIDVMYSCEQGLCGACEVKFLEGKPDHRDSVCAPEDHDRDSTVIICQAGCHSAKLVLDL